MGHWQILTQLMQFLQITNKQNAENNSDESEFLQSSVEKSVIWQNCANNPLLQVASWKLWESKFRFSG